MCDRNILVWNWSWKCLWFKTKEVRKTSNKIKMLWDSVPSRDAESGVPQNQRKRFPGNRDMGGRHPVEGALKQNKTFWGIK